MTETTYQPKFLRGGRTLTRDEAIRLIVDGRVVTVAVPDEDMAGMGDLSVTIRAGNWNWSGGEACTATEIDHPRTLASGDLEVYAAVIATAASLCDDVNAALLARDLADA